MRGWLIVLSLLAVAGLADAGAAQQPHTSQYAGEENRRIKSLSADDIDELRRGGGWGLAKAAELNGVPGPAHLLELKDDIALSAAQVERIAAMMDDMRRRAIVVGERLIELEGELEDHFRQRTITDAVLKSLLDQIASERGRLRYVHLSTHLQTPLILTEEQIARYNRLRGYGVAACDAVPEGHDAALWRKHNDCG